MDTGYISRASRALAAVTIVRQAAVNEVAVLSGAEYETTQNPLLGDAWMDMERKLWKRADVLKTYLRESWSRSTARPRIAETIAHSFRNLM